MKVISARFTVATVIALLAWSSPAHASLITEVITLTPLGPDGPTYAAPPPGTTYTWTVTFDSELMARSGHNLSVTLADYDFRIDTVSWPKGYGAFRGPCPGVRDLCADAPSPGFDVMDGRIVGLEGGVYSRYSDIPFVDFGGGGFLAYGLFAGYPGPLYRFHGTFAFSTPEDDERERVPQPVALVLLGLGALLVLMARACSPLVDRR